MHSTICTCVFVGEESTVLVGVITPTKVANWLHVYIYITGNEPII